jgi:predicted P-loop ATPase
VQAETVIFISPKQGTGKSSLCKILALESDWYLGKYKLGGTEQNSLPLLAGKWVVELSELAGLSKTDFEDVKTLLTSTEDEYVAKYEAIPTVHRRRCCFIGTSNLRQPLADPSGNRRFLPVHVQGAINLDWLQENIEQLIGEAAARETAGESFAIPEEMWALTTAQQEAARNLSPVEESIIEWFDRPEAALYVLAADIRRALDMAGLHATARYGVFMENLGWRYTQAPTRSRDRIWMKGITFPECICLEPAQLQMNGRVEMRMSRKPPY